MNWANVRLLVTDFDGVHTADAVYVDQNGVESVRCLRADGYGITRLQAAGVPVIVLSAEVNPVVAARCRKLGVRCMQGQTDKLAVLMAYSRGWHEDPGMPVPEGVPLEHIAYMGNDVNDLECLKAVGIPVVVRNAERAVFEALGCIHAYTNEPIIGAVGVVYVTLRSGGYGAVREVCDLILEARNGSR